MIGLNSLAWLGILAWIILPVLAGCLFARLYIARKTSHQKVLAIVAGISLLATPWIISSLVKVYYNNKVSALCDKDGGVKVYETVTLPKERFNQWGRILIPNIKNYGNLNDEYYYESFPNQLRNGNPEIYQLHEKVYRKIDRKLLGETVRYSRRGGDLPGPWAASFFSCPNESDITDLNKQIFKMHQEKP